MRGTLIAVQVAILAIIAVYGAGVDANQHEKPTELRANIHPE
ncbi:hypothetical protein [Roseovarius albus]|nr:hypothetical protein [Roseovarius albus]